MKESQISEVVETKDGVRHDKGKRKNSDKYEDKFERKMKKKWL